MRAVCFTCTASRPSRSPGEPRAARPVGAGHALRPAGATSSSATDCPRPPRPSARRRDRAGLALHGRSRRAGIAPARCVRISARSTFSGPPRNVVRRAGRGREAPGPAGRSTPRDAPVDLAFLRRELRRVGRRRVVLRRRPSCPRRAPGSVSTSSAPPIVASRSPERARVVIAGDRLLARSSTGPVSSPSSISITLTPVTRRPPGSPAARGPRPASGAAARSAGSRSRAAGRSSTSGVRSSP